MRVAVFYNKSRIGLEKLSDLSREIETHGIEVQFCSDRSSCPVEGAEAILTFGGDGTVLKAVPMASSFDLPIMSFRVGSVGFLAAFEMGNLHYALDLLLDKRLNCDERPLMEASFGSEKFLALNDFGVERSSPSRTVSLLIAVDNHSVYPVVGDGIIFSTNTGSTAYSMAAGGALVDPQAQCFQITPICAHNPFVGPLVLSSSRRVRLTILKDKGFPLEAYVDGSFNRKVFQGTEIDVRMSEKTVKLLREGDFDFVALLKEKLAFGGRLKDDIGYGTGQTR